jgi:hypothetical protein
MESLAIGLQATLLKISEHHSGKGKCAKDELPQING